jgi:hypothetical protein
VLRPRRLHAYGVGMGSSGTTSLALVFRPKYRAEHEPDSDALISHVLRVAETGRGAEDLAEYVRERDRRLWLELDSSSLNYYILDYLLEFFPAARFVMVIRDPWSWLGSKVKHKLTYPASEAWSRLAVLRYSTGKPHPAEEQSLAARGVYPLEGYLGFWARHNRKVLATVPRDRMIVVRTDELTAKLPEIASFLGVPYAALNVGAVHSNKAKIEFDLCAEVTPDYLNRLVRAHCQDLVEEYFPELSKGGGGAA